MKMAQVSLSPRCLKHSRLCSIKEMKSPCKWEEIKSTVDSSSIYRTLNRHPPVLIFNRKGKICLH